MVFMETHAREHHSALARTHPSYSGNPSARPPEAASPTAAADRDATRISVVGEKMNFPDFALTLAAGTL
jgi:hypothetical protein